MECAICFHPDRESIERQIVAGEPSRAIAARWDGFSDYVVRRHKKEHLAASLLSTTRANLPDGEDLLDGVRYLQERALRILDEAESVGALKVALDAIKTAQSNYELQAKIRGIIEERQTNQNLLLLGGWPEVKTRILAALDGHPEARQRVARALLPSAGEGDE